MWLLCVCRPGWLGDALDASEQAIYNFDMAPVYEAYFQTIEDNQDPATGDLPAVVPKLQWLAQVVNNSEVCTDIAWSSA